LASTGPRTVERLGGGWIAEEALAIAVYAALVHPEPEQVIDVERRRGLATPRRTPVLVQGHRPSNGRPDRPSHHPAHTQPDIQLQRSITLGGRRSGALLAIGFPPSTPPGCRQSSTTEQCQQGNCPANCRGARLVRGRLLVPPIWPLRVNARQGLVLTDDRQRNPVTAQGGHTLIEPVFGDW